MSIGKKNYKFFIMSIILILIFTISIFLMFNLISGRKTALDEVKLKGEKKVPDGLAIMLENDSNDGKYAESKSSVWPSSTDYRFNKELSGCIDNDGNTVSDALTYNKSTNSVSIKTKSNLSCYMYFDLKFYLSELCESGDTLGSCITENNEEIDSLNNNIEGGLYRYQGTNIDVDDNYICFGTDDKEKCTSNTDAYMYRIIGIDSNGQLKLIKKEALNEQLRWYNDASQNILWLNSLLYTNINGAKYLTNSTYIPSGWSNKIVNYDWKYGNISTINKTSDNLYTAENEFINIITAKVSLMYLHDYTYAYQSTGLNCSTSNSSAACKDSWIHITNNDHSSIVNFEWTMSYYGLDSSSEDYRAWSIYENGSLSRPNIDALFVARPVFYLKADEQYISGNGTIDNPIIISGPIMHTVNVSSTNTTYGTVTPTTQEVVDTGNATITISPNTGYKYSSNTCGGTVSENTMTISNITSAKTCTVTFVEDGTRFGKYLISAKTAGWNSTAYSGMYRYIGTTANNYVKLGDVLYRIIGVTSEANDTLGLAANQVKVIKAATMGGYNWHTSHRINKIWESSDIYTYLQGSSVLGSTSVIPSGWTDKISSVKWNIGDVQTYTNGNTVYGLEDNTQTTNTSKIGLMYLSDWYYAYNAGGTQNCISSPYCVSWMAGTSHTWTMSRYGYYRSGDYFAWIVYTNGSVSFDYLTYAFAVRPVFYLSTSVNWKSGTGTSGDPFIIE